MVSDESHSRSNSLQRVYQGKLAVAEISLQFCDTEADTYASSSKDQIVGAVRLHVILQPPFRVEVVRFGEDFGIVENSPCCRINVCVQSYQKRDPQAFIKRMVSLGIR